MCVCVCVYWRGIQGDIIIRKTHNMVSNTDRIIAILQMSKLSPGEVY